MNKDEDNFSNVLKHFITYFTGDVVSRLIAFLLIPVLTFLLTPNDFGILSVFTSLTLLLLTLLSLNTYTSIGRYYFEENIDLSSFLSSVIAFSLVIMLLFFTVIVSFKKEISAFIKIPSELVYYVLPIVLLLSLRSIFSQYCRAKEESKTVSRMNVYYTMSYAIFAVLLLLYSQDGGYKSVIWANISVQTGVAIYIVYRFRGYLSIFKIRKIHVSYALAYGIPLIPYTLSTELLTSFDVLMINSYLGADEAGVYGFAYKIGSLLLVFIIAINSAWTPKYMRYMNAKNYIKHDDFSIKVMNATLLAAAVLISYGDIIASAISPVAYDKGVNLIPLIVLGYVFYMVFVIYNKHTTYIKKLIYQSMVAIMGGVVNVVANIIFIPKFGIVAAAYTTLGSFILMAFLSWVVNLYIIRIDSVSVRNMLTTLAPIVVLVVVKQQLINYRFSIMNSILINTIMLLAIIVVVTKGRVNSLKGFMS
ncbi:MAG: oligosaccharide flippase family protein [Gammaproteobacteria bacterium]|jgi:O-antigen/teichoic acid export membrane protein